MVDEAIPARLFCAHWLAFGRRLAAGAGALVALISLLVHVPLFVASLRGAGTALALLAVVHLGRRALAWSLAVAERSGAESDGPAEEKPMTKPMSASREAGGRRG